jgi:DNA-binding PadR family transcriptional regulator
MARRDDIVDLEEFGRFAEPALLILVSLAEGPKHGYAITEDIAAFADVRFGPGSLYGAIARLESRGLIEPLRSEDRRNPYQLTALGEQALRARLASMQAVARIGQKRLATP